VLHFITQHGALQCIKICIWLAQLCIQCSSQ